MTPIEITVFEKTGGPLTKKISLHNGKIISDGSACLMSEGTARRVVIDDIETLASLINGMKSNEAYALGRIVDGQPAVCRVVTKEKLNGGMRGTIARTRDYLAFGEGKPGLVLLDYNAKAMSEAVRANMEQCGDLWGALCEVLPGIGEVACVVRPSTSSGLSDQRTGQKFPESGGRHIVIPVEDASDIDRFLRDLHDRCWLNGFGWGMVGAAGTFLVRAIVDPSVGSPERLIFEGKPIVEKPLMQSGREAQAHEGTMLNTRACPPLSAEERSRVAAMKAAERQRLAGAIQKARDNFTEAHVKRVVASGKSDLEARVIISRWMDRKELTGEFPLPFDDSNLSGKPVAEVLIAPERYIGKTLADPFEGVAYGRGKAVLYRRDDGSLFINSFAHGGMTYELKARAAALELLWGDAAAMPQAMGTIVKGILHASSLTLVYGPPKSGKSFLVTDSFVAIADENRTEWMGHTIMRHGPVLYVACEGHAGFWKRLAALKLDRGMSLPGNFALARGRPVLIDLDPKSHQAIPHPDDVLDAVARMTADGKKPVAVAIDTVFRSVGAGNVSASDHMNAYLSALAAIQDQGIALVAVHHEVKAGGTPAGSVTLIGGSDTIINTKRLDGGGHSWSVEMAKDDIETKERPFTLEIVPVGANADEDDLTSCVVRDGSAKNSGAAVRMDRVKLSKSARVALAALSEAIGEAGADVQHKDLPPGVKAVTISQWREKAYARGVSDGDTEAKRKAFKRAFDALNADRFIGVADPYVWIAD